VLFVTVTVVCCSLTAWITGHDVLAVMLVSAALPWCAQSCWHRSRRPDWHKTSSVV
jgi:hypothetical protein